MAHVRQSRDVRVGEIVAILGGAVLLATSWVLVAADARVPEAESIVFHWVNDLPDLLWPVIWGPMQLGSFVGSLVVVGVVGIVSRNLRLTLAALVASQAAYWLASAIKRSVTRGRPAALLKSVDLREHAAGLGYVSGHTAVAFALATVVAPSVPRVWRVPIFLAAAVVGFARIYSGAHLPLDVIGGAGVGILVGTLSRWAFGLGGEGLPAHHGAGSQAPG